MMKYFIWPSILIVSFAFYSISNRSKASPPKPVLSFPIEAVYKYQSTKEQIQKKKEKAPPEIAGMLENVMGAYFIEFDFIQSEGKSLFKKKPETYISKKRNEEDGGTLSYHMEMKDDVVFKNFENNSLIAQKHMSSRVYNICDQLPKFEWTLMSEKKNILGFLCQRAMIKDYYNRRISVWYAPEIPLPNGPLEFGGLPGLILEWTDGLHVCTAIEFKQDNDKQSPSEQSCKSGKESVSLNQYYSKLKR